MKAVLQYRASPGFRARLEHAAPDWLTVSIVDEDDRELFAKEIADSDVLLHVLEPVTAAVFDAAPKLRLVQKLGVGVNTIDLEAARAHGCAVANMPGTNTQAVAEAALALTLAALRRLPVVDRATRAGEGWRLDPGVVDGFGEIGGRTVGLIGFGAVAARFADVLLALGARVLYTARGPKAYVAAEWRTLDELLAESDIVSLHCPLTPETQSMIDAAAIARMRAGVVLVNTARGALIDEGALIDGLRSGHVAAAGLDVFVEEPVDPDNPLLGLDNVVVSPHVAWLTGETLDRSLTVAFENCRRVRADEPLLHEVVPAAPR